VSDEEEEVSGSSGGGEREDRGDDMAGSRVCEASIRDDL
jgi:hypothetical protein